MKVFVMNTYDEDGPIDLRVTTDITKLPEMLENEWSAVDRTGWAERFVEKSRQQHKEEMAKLWKWMEEWDGELVDRHGISIGWGGVQISVVEMS